MTVTFELDGQESPPSTADRISSSTRPSRSGLLRLAGRGGSLLEQVERRRLRGAVRRLRIGSDSPGRWCRAGSMNDARFGRGEEGRVMLAFLQMRNSTSPRSSALRRRRRLGSRVAAAACSTLAFDRPGWRRRSRSLRARVLPALPVSSSASDPSNPSVAEAPTDPAPAPPPAEEPGIGGPHGHHGHHGHGERAVDAGPPDRARPHEHHGHGEQAGAYVARCTRVTAPAPGAKGKMKLVPRSRTDGRSSRAGDWGRRSRGRSESRPPGRSHAPPTRVTTLPSASTHRRIGRDHAIVEVR